MLPGVRVPASFAAVLAPLRVCFTAPTFATFTALVVGMIAQTGPRTVCGMLVGAGLAQRWHHARAHRLFAAARWCADAVGVLLADMIIDRSVPAHAPLVMAIDDTLFARCGRRVYAAAWLPDASLKTRPAATRWGNCWVVAGLLVELPFAVGPVCLPILARLWVPGSGGRRRATRAAAAAGRDTKQQPARDLIEIVAWRYPRRRVHVVVDGLYGSRDLRALPPNVSVTARLRVNAALYHPAPHRRGGRGRPRTKGDRLPTLPTLCATATDWATATVTGYGRRSSLAVLERPCLWYTVWLTQPTRLICTRAGGTGRGYDLALITTDLATDAAAIIERSAAR
jgi:DDE superfamily endonuclease